MSLDTLHSISKNVETRTKELILKICDSEYLIVNDTSLTNDLGFDSVKILELILELEKEFEIVFEDEDLDFDNLNVYGNMLRIVTKKISRR